MVRKVSKFVYWTPRILSIIFLLFLTMFSLDVFGNGYTFWQTVAGLLMHNIPVFILAILLIVAWKNELVVAIAFILAGLLYIGFVLNKIFSAGFEWYYLSWILIIAGPAFLVGILFFIGWKKKRKGKQKELKVF